MAREQGVERLGSKDAGPRQNKSAFVISWKCFVSIIIGVISIKITPIVHAGWEPLVSTSYPIIQKLSKPIELFRVILHHST